MDQLSPLLQCFMIYQNNNKHFYFALEYVVSKNSVSPFIFGPFCQFSSWPRTKNAEKKEKF